MNKKVSFLLILFITFSLAGHSWAYEAAVVKSADIEPYDEALKGFRSSCGCDVRTFTASGTQGSRIQEEIYQLRPDVVLAIGMDALRRVRTVTNLPVVYVMVPGPSTGSPKEGNMSGVSMYISPSRYLDAIRKLFPWARRIGVVYDPKSADTYVKDAMKSASARGIELVAKKAESAGVVPSLLDSMEDKIDLFWMLPETALLNPATVDYMLLFSFENKVPIFTFSKKYIDMGAAAALTIDSFGMGVQAGEVARRLQSAGTGQIRLNANVSGVVVNRMVIEKLGIKLDEKLMGWAKDADR